MYQFIMIIHVLAAICVIGLVLVQQGKGATMGAAFGSGASQTVFGSRGSGSFLLKLTIGFIALFFITSIGLNRLAVSAARKQETIILPVPTAKKINIPSEHDSSSVSPENLPKGTT